jgi:hypothetical protein
MKDEAVSRYGPEENSKRKKKDTKRLDEGKRGEKEKFALRKY